MYELHRLLPTNESYFKQFYSIRNDDFDYKAFQQTHIKYIKKQDPNSNNTVVNVNLLQVFKNFRQISNKWVNKEY